MIFDYVIFTAFGFFTVYLLCDCNYTTLYYKNQIKLSHLRQYFGF